MSIAGSFRPGHSEREVLRNYVSSKTVEEVVVSRKAHHVMGQDGPALQPRPPPRTGSARGGSGSGSGRANSARAARARVHNRLAVHPTMASAGGSARIRQAALAKAKAAARKPDPKLPAAQAQLARIQNLVAGLDDLMATPAHAFGDVSALAAMAPPAMAALLSRGTPRQRAVPEPEPELEPVMTPEAIFARELLGGWLSAAADAVGRPADQTIFDRLLVANTVTKQGKTKVPTPEPEPPPETPPEARLQKTECTMGNFARVATDPLEARAACRDIDLKEKVHAAKSWTREKQERCGTVGQVVGVFGEKQAVRLRFDGELLWFAREALRPVAPGDPRAPGSRPISSALIDEGGLHYLSHALTPETCCTFTVQFDRLPAPCVDGVVCGIMAVAPNRGANALLGPDAELSTIREQSFALENTYTGLHQQEEFGANGPACYHEGKICQMTCDLRTDAIGLPKVMLGGSGGIELADPDDAVIESSWMDKMTADDKTDAERKAKERATWIGALRFECDLTELDGVYVNTCKVPAPPAQTIYRAFVRLPKVAPGEEKPRFYVSWKNAE